MNPKRQPRSRSWWTLAILASIGLCATLWADTAQARFYGWRGGSCGWGRPWCGPIGRPWCGPIGRPWCGPIGRPWCGSIGRPWCGPIGRPWCGPIGRPWCRPYGGWGWGWGGSTVVVGGYPSSFYYSSGTTLYPGAPYYSYGLGSVSVTPSYVAVDPTLTQSYSQDTQAILAQNAYLQQQIQALQQQNALLQQQQQQVVPMQTPAPVNPNLTPVAPSAKDGAKLDRMRRSLMQRSRQNMASGTRLFQSGKYMAAADHFREATRLTGSDPTPYFMLGQSLFAARRYDEAALAIRRGLQVNPEWLEAEFDMRTLYGDEDKPLAQLADLAGRLQVNPLDREILFLLGYELFVTGEKEKARTILEQVARLESNDKHLEPFFDYYAKVEEAMKLQPAGGTIQ